MSASADGWAAKRRQAIAMFVWPADRISPMTVLRNSRHPLGDIPTPDWGAIFSKRHSPDPMGVVVSRPGESHPQPLAERCVSLSTHTAPIKQTRQPSHAASAQTDGAVASRYPL